MTDFHKDEDLAAKARKILAQETRVSEAQAKVKKDDSVEEVFKTPLSYAKKLKGIFNNAVAMADTALFYLGPVGKAVRFGAQLAGSALAYAAFERENGDYKRDEDGNRIFSGSRMAKVFALAAGTAIAANLGVQYGYYKATQFDELIYTTGKQEIVEGELYHVTGCTSLPCSTATDNGKYYQIERSYFWPRQLYPEENIYANVPQQIAACEIEGYGVYFKDLRFLHKWFEWYQNIESVSCRPLTESEVQGMMESPAP